MLNRPQQNLPSSSSTAVNTLWRAYPRPPHIVFREGLKTYGTSLNYFRHIVSDASQYLNSGLLSTSSISLFAIMFARFEINRSQLPAYYVYEIRADHNFYNGVKTALYLKNSVRQPVTRTMLDTLEREGEYITPGNISPRLIKRATIFTRNAANQSIDQQVYENPHYVEANTQANPGPYTGCVRDFPWNLRISGYHKSENSITYRLAPENAALPRLPR